MICQNPNCRQPNPDDVSYCQHCGRAFPPPAKVAEPEPYSPRGRGEEKRRSPILFYIAIWVPILIATFLIIAFS